METTVTPKPVAIPLQQTNNNSPHNTSKKKCPNSPQLTFYNTEYSNSEQSTSAHQEHPKRSVLVAKRRHVKLKSDATTGPNESQTSNTEIKIQTAIPETQTPQTNHVNPGSSTMSESRIAETFKAFQRMRGQNHRRSPKKGHNSQISNDGRRQRFDEMEDKPDPDAGKKVLVSGFPSYTRVQDLVRVLSELGTVEILRCRNRLAVVMFETEQLARSALDASEELYIFGEFLKIHPYTNAGHVEELYRSFKKVIKPKVHDIISPTEIDLSGDFDQQFENVQKAVRLSREEVTAITQLYVDVETVLRTVWPGCRAVPFGSIPTGLGIKSSDADCFVQGAGGGSCGGGGGGGAGFVSRARRALAQRPDLFAQLVAIPRANTPIVKFLHVPTSRHCDLSAKTPLGSQNSRLIKHVLDGDPRLAPLAVALKYWARVHELSGTGRLTNYALVTMIVFYLQQPHVALAPPVEALQREPAARLLLDHWDAGFEPRADLVRRNDASTAELLGGFFRFYAAFDFDGSVVCPLIGAPVKKAAFEDPRSLPPQFARYVRNVERNLTGPLRHGTAFCVQDPFELSHNVASSVTYKLARDIRAHFEFASAAFAGERAHFLRAVLLTKPALERRPRAFPTTRVHLVPRVRGDILAPDWRACVRDIIVEDIFATALHAHLEREPERAEGAAAGAGAGAVTRERWSARVPRGVWRRRGAEGGVEPRDTLVRRQAAATARLLRPGAGEPLPVLLELGFRDAPARSCYLLARQLAGDLDQFRMFVRFLHTTVFDWFRALLRPSLRVEEAPPAPAPPPPPAITFEPEEPELAGLLAAACLRDRPLGPAPSE